MFTIPTLRRFATARTTALSLLCLAISAALAAPVQAANTANAADSTRDMPYALVRGDGQTMTINYGDDGDRDRIRQVRGKIKGEFIWFREDGHAYVIQDPATLAKARTAWAPVDRLGEQMNAYGRDMDRQGQAMGAYGQQMGEAAARIQPDPRKMQAQQRQMNVLSQRMAALGSRMGSADEGEQARLNREMAQLNMQMSDLGRQMGAGVQDDAQRQTRRQMDELDRRMQDQQAPMNALGQKMKVLGKDIERESRTADATLRSLIHDAQAHGLAHPAPQG